ncbi:hypothetical protein Tco_1047631, partial [Tanacetum coccineum]
LVADETIYKEWEDKMERAATTASRLEAEQDSEQFWQTASASTLENGDMEITAIIDGKVKVVSEASIRRHPKLEDSDGISTLPTSEILEQLALMGSKKTDWEQFSSNIATAIICLATNRTFNFSKLIFDAMVKNLDIESHHTPINAPSTSQPPTLPPSMPTTYVAEEAANMPHYSLLLGGHTPGSDEGSMTLNELTVLCTQLSTKVASLEADLKQTKKVYGNAYTKLIMKVKKLEHKVKSSKARRRAQFVVSDDEEDDSFNQGRKIDEYPDISLVQQMIHHDAQTQGRQEYDLEPNFEFTAPEEVYTAEPDISTAHVPVSTASAEVSTAAESLVYIRRSTQEQERLGFEDAQRLQQQFDKEERQRIASVHEEASTFKPEELDNIQAQIEADEELAHRLQAQERERYSEADKAKLVHMGIHTLQQLRGYSFDEIKVLFEATVKRVNTFTPMKSDDTIPKVVAGSSKRSTEDEHGEESSKRQKIGEGSEPAKE